MVAHEVLLKKMLRVLWEQGSPSTAEERTKFNCQFYRDHGVASTDGRTTSAISKFHRYVRENKMPPFVKADPELKKMFREAATPKNRGWRIPAAVDRPATEVDEDREMREEELDELLAEERQKKLEEQLAEETAEKDSLAKECLYLKASLKVREEELQKKTAATWGLEKDALLQTRRTEQAERDVLLLKTQLRHQEHAIRMMESAIRDKDDVIAMQKELLSREPPKNLQEGAHKPQIVPKAAPDSPLLPPAWCWM